MRVRDDAEPPTSRSDAEVVHAAGPCRGVTTGGVTTGAAGDGHDAASIWGGWGAGAGTTCASAGAAGDGHDAASIGDGWGDEVGATCRS